MLKGLLTVILLTLCCSCSSPFRTKDSLPNRNVDVSHIPDAIPKVEPRSSYGNPKSYVVNGKRYYTLPSAANYNRRGIASWYGTKFHGHLTSTREPYNMFAMTAASTELPIPCYAKVTNLENGRQIIVRVNDRGPFDKDRIMDLSYAAAKKLGVLRKGTALVQVTTIDPRNWQRNRSTFHQQPVHRQPRLFLQIGAFSNRENAENLAASISNLTSEPIHIQADHAQQLPIYRVQVGPLLSVDESDLLKAMIEKQGLGQAITVVA